MLIPYLFIAMRFIVIGLAIICAIAGLVTISTGKLSLARTSEAKGASARVAGGFLLVLAAVMASFALGIIPGLSR